jgi:hypothetical protein
VAPGDAAAPSQPWRPADDGSACDHCEYQHASNRSDRTSCDLDRRWGKRLEPKPATQSRLSASSCRAATCFEPSRCTPQHPLHFYRARHSLVEVQREYIS